jgi:hypothetical protein
MIHHLPTVFGKLFRRQPRPDNFAGYPKTIGEIRSDRSNSGADWKPRDALIDVLREIDEGRISPEAIVICMREPDKERANEAHTKYRVASPDPHVTFGLLSATLFKVQRDSDS